MYIFIRRIIRNMTSHLDWNQSPTSMEYNGAVFVSANSHRVAWRKTYI